MADSSWPRVRRRLRQELGAATWRSWLAGFELVDHGDERVRIAAPTRVKRDCKAKHHNNRWRPLWRTEIPTLRDVEVIVA